MKLVHRYIISDFLGQFFICSLGISIFMLGFVLYKEAASLINYHVPFSMIMRLLLNAWPRVILDVMPGAGLFAVILSLGRMVRERELQVFRLSGWSFPHVIWPLLGLTLVLSYGVFLWNDNVVPASERSYAKAWAKLTSERVYNFITANRFISGPDNTQFYVGSVDRRTGEMRDIMVYQLNPGKMPRLITAASGRLDGQVWTLRDGVVHEINKDGFIEMEIGFKQRTVNTKRDLSFAFANPIGGPTEMNRAQLRAEAKKLEPLSQTGQRSLPANGYWLEYHMKLASPFALFVFTTLAIPFACLSERNGRVAILLPALLLYLAYFLILTVMYAMGQNGLLQPWLAAWGCNIIFGSLALAMVLTAVR